MGYLGQICPGSFLAHLPNPLADEFTDRGLDRDIDVLVQRRKCSKYVLDVLVPELARAGVRVEVLDNPVDSLSDHFRRSRVFLYDSDDHWLRNNLSEGFGLPPIEAVASGCVPFTSVNAGLSDFAGPELNVHKIAAGSFRYQIPASTQRLAGGLVHDCGGGR